MTLTYLDINGNALSPPITNDDVINLLRSITVTVALTSNSTLSDGEQFTATVTQTVGIRNLNYFF